MAAANGSRDLNYVPSYVARDGVFKDLIGRSSITTLLTEKMLAKHSVLDKVTSPMERCEYKFEGFAKNSDGEQEDNGPLIRGFRLWFARACCGT